MARGKARVVAPKKTKPAGKSKAEVLYHRQIVESSLAAAGLGEWSINLITGENFFSRQISQLFGLPEDHETTLSDIENCCDPEDFKRVQIETQGALKDRTVGFLRTTARINRPDGAKRHIEARGKIYRNGHGKAVRVLGVMLDITESAHHALAQSWRRFETALANDALMVFHQNTALQYTWVHCPRDVQAAQAMLGKTDAELMDADIAAPLEAMKRVVIETGRPAHEQAAAHWIGRSCRYDLFIEPRRDRDGAIIGITCAAIELADTSGAGPQVVDLDKALPDRDVLLDRIGARGPAGVMARGLLTVCTTALQRKLSGYVTLMPDDLSLLAKLEKKRRFVGARREICVDESDGSAMAWLIGNGWNYSYTLLPGGERQIVNFHLPGDIIWPGGHRGYRPSHSFATITDCLLCEIDEAALAQLRRSQTRLSDALDWADSRDEAILAQHLVSLGRRPAIARVAHLLLELAMRLRLVGQANEHGYRCPLSQELMADALGLTSIHVNRMLRELRELGCLTFRNGYVDIHDESKLVRLADFDPSYLDQGRKRTDLAAEQHAAGLAGSAGGQHQALSR